MKKRFLLVLVGFIFTIPVGAQVWTPPAPPQINMQNQIWRNFRMAQIGNQIAADMARSGRANKNRSGTGKTVTAPPAANYSAVYQKQFSFQRAAGSPLAQKMTELQKGGANDSAKMQQIVDYMWGKYEVSFADENRRLKMPFNDVVTAMTYYIVGSYLYANDLQSSESEYSVAVYKQLSEILTKDAEFAKLQPADKQMLAELLVTLGGMPAAAYDQNRDRNEKMRIGLTNLERIFGAQAKNLQITANGIEF